MKSFNVGKIFLLRNRGILLDVCVFVSSIFLMRVMTGNFIELTRAPKEDSWAKLAIALFYTGLLILSPLGAMLKRHQFWKRIEAQDKENQVEKNIRRFFFSPWFCFVWLWIIYAMVVVSWHQFFLPDSFISSQWIVYVIFFFGMFYCFVGAWAISKFYQWYLGDTFWQLQVKGATYDLSDFPITKLFPFLDRPFFDGFWKFFESPLAAALGDLCIFLNMILFQIFWNYLFSHFYGEGVQNTGEVFYASMAYLLVLCLFYFPPRNFYLAEDVHRPFVWLTMITANLPSFLYFFFRIRIF